MPSYRRVASLDDIPPGHGKGFAVGDREVAVFNVDGVLYAIDGTCPHQGGPLAEGWFEDGVVTCPWHAFDFDSGTGACLIDDALRVATYPVRIEAGEILVDLPETGA